MIAARLGGGGGDNKPHTYGNVAGDLGFSELTGMVVPSQNEAGLFWSGGWSRAAAQPQVPKTAIYRS
jgi:hypothetical protein